MRVVYYLAAAVMLVCLPMAVRADDRAVNTANDMMQKRLFRDAIKILTAAVEKQNDPESARELRLLGESYYMVKDYGNARSFYMRALPHQTSAAGKSSCEARLAVLDYRMGDLAGAEERIANFLRRYPSDERVGMLMVIRIRIVQDSKLTVAEKIAKVEAEYDKIAKEKDRFGYYNFVLAAQVLGDLYIEANNGEKAVALYVKAVHQMRSLIAALKGEGKPVPKDLSQGVDGMSLQIAKYYLSRKDYGEAQKWLENASHAGEENVAYDEEMKNQAKYLLAQLFYQKGEYGEVLFHLQDDLIAKTADGETKWGMCMLAAFAWRDGRTPDVEKAKELFKQIPSVAGAYAQAQHALADIYRDQKDPERAVPHYVEAAKSAKYAPTALLQLTLIAKNRADAMKPRDDAEKAAREAIYRKAGAYLQELLTKYPLSGTAKEGKALAAALQAQGITVATETSVEDKLAAWSRTAREKAGTAEAAQALISLAQQHGRTVSDPRTHAIVRPPDWKSVMEACLPIARSPQPFKDVSPERWQEMQAIAFLFMGRAELGSLPAGASSKRLQSEHIEPVRIDGGGSTVRALEHLRHAQKLVKPQQDLAREIEFGIVEALLKSEERALRDEGERRYAEMETRYGSDPGYQRLAMITADWLDDHGQFEMAARTYRTIAKKSNLDRADIMQLLYLAGVCYGKAGRNMLEGGNQAATLAFLVQPRAVSRADVSIFRAHPPFQYVKHVPWEKQGPDLTAADALVRISQEFGVPFVWSPSAEAGSVNDYLRKTVIPRATLASWREPRSLAEYFAAVVNTNRYAVDFDLGVTGGKPTLSVKAVEGGEIKALEIYDPTRTRFPALVKPYGDFAVVHGKPVMLYTIIKRIEELTGARVIWDESIPKDEALSREFGSLPGVARGQSAPCDQALRATIESIGLRCEVVRRDRSRELIQESNEAFDELRRFGADVRYAEDAMFNIAVNLFVLKDYDFMKRLLREYLKTYDNPSFTHYYDVCFWLGRLFEIDRNFRDAARYYIRASEERVVIHRPAVGTPAPSLDELKARLSYETLFNLSRPGTGSFKETRLEGAFLSFLRFNTNVEIGLDNSARGLESTITRENFTAVPCIKILHEALVSLGLDLRTENGDPKVAEKAYYRLALVYKEDNLMSDALEYVNTLLRRFPDSPLKVEALKLKLDIYKGLKDYGNVLAVLDELKQAAAGKIEPFILEYETGRVYFDLCDYATADAAFARALEGTRDPDERLKIREAQAITLLRSTNRWNEALACYREIARQETSAARQSVNALMIWFLEGATDSPPTRRPLPERELTFITMYERLSEKQRNAMDQNELARATWIYYAMGLADLHVDRKRNDALRKFEAASASSDTFLAGESLYEAGMILMAEGEYRRAKETFEHLLFATKAVEPSVKATHALAACWRLLGDANAAGRRLEEVVLRFPASPYAALAKADPLYISRQGGEERPAGGAGAKPGPGAAGAHSGANK